MAKRYLTNADGSMTAVESTRRAKRRGAGRVLPRSARKIRTPNAIRAQQRYAAVLRREDDGAFTPLRSEELRAQRRTAFIFIMAIAVIFRILLFFRIIR